MFKLRLAILGATAALALGTASALAMSEGVGGGGDSHGDAVASAARNCPHHASGDRDSHGDCVSAIASANGQAHRDGQQSAKVQACKAAEASNTSATDKAAHMAFAACVSGHSKSAASESSEVTTHQSSKP